MQTAHFRGVLDKLEIARGHDGFLRGGPEPVLVVAVYVASARVLRMIGRSLHRFVASEPFPAEVRPDAAVLPSADVQSETPVSYVVLAIALEEDGGKDVQRFFGAVEHQELLSVWNLERSEVEPLSLAAVAGQQDWLLPTRVEMLVDGQPAAASCTSDKWIGAVCFSPTPRVPAAPSSYRLPFLAPNRKNDWTALVTLQH